MRASLAVAVVIGVASSAAADGEVTPMLGVAVVGADTARTPSQDEPLAGVALDLAFWHGRFGLGGEASERWSLETDGTHATVVGASARVRVYECLMPSLLDPRDVELGVELQAIVERGWWSGAMSDVDPTAYGLGVAIRMRGGGDADNSILLAESRLFLRVMSARWAGVDAVARTTEPTGPSERALTVLVGIGASFGAGTPGYVHKFRLRPFQPTLLW